MVVSLQILRTAHVRPVLGGVSTPPPSLCVHVQATSCVQNGEPDSELDAAHWGPSGLLVIPEGRCCAHETGANSEAVMSQLTPSRAPTLCSHCRWAQPQEVGDGAPGRRTGRPGHSLSKARCLWDSERSPLVRALLPGARTQ